MVTVRAGYDICRTQCQTRMWVALFKIIIKAFKMARAALGILILTLLRWDTPQCGGRWAISTNRLTQVGLSKRVYW